MQPVFADPQTDFVFKRIFGAEAHKPLLVALLNHLLELGGARAIRDVEHLPTEQHVDVPELKLSIVDVKCTDTTGRKFVVEMQVLKVEGFEKRVVYNASKAYVMQLRNADEYPALCDVVGVTICNFNLWTDQDATGGYRVPMLSRWRMQEQHSGASGLGQVQYVFLELPKYPTGQLPDSLVAKWAYFFREAKNLDVIPPELDQNPFRDAFDVARSATFSPQEWDAYQRAKMAEQDARGALVMARREGEAEGVAQGMAQGMAQGVAQGVAQGIAKGKAEGKAEAILSILEARAIVMSPEKRARILSCTDLAILARWLERSMHVARVAEL